MNIWETTPLERQNLRVSLEGLLQNLGAKAVAASELAGKLERLHLECHRHYHTLGHLRDMFLALEIDMAQAQNPAALRLAVWFHDSIYNPFYSDNEARSAEFSRLELGKLALEPALIATVSDLVLTTQSHIANSPDAQLLLDADLGVLAAPLEVYRAYSEAIRQEYHKVPLPLYRSERAKILKKFLERPQIYQRKTWLEGRARENLTWEIGALL